MASFDILRADPTVDVDSHEQRTPDSFDTNSHTPTVQILGFEKRVPDSFGIISHTPEVSFVTFTKREIDSFGIQPIGVAVPSFSFDRLGEFAERFTTVTCSLEFEETGDPVEEGLFLFTTDGQTAVGDINDSIALLTLLNEKPHSEFFVMTAEVGTAHLDYVFHIAGVDPNPVEPPTDKEATITVREPSLDLGTVMGKGDVEELLSEIVAAAAGGGLSA